MKPDWYSNVQPVRSVREASGSWDCDCVEIVEGDEQPVMQPGYRVNCPDCFARRPGS